MVDHTLGRVLDLFDIEIGKVRRWTGGKGARRSQPARRAASLDGVAKSDLVD